MTGDRNAVQMRWVRRGAVVILVTMGSAAFTLSFAALRELAVMAHTPRALEWSWPVGGV
ncbi:DUF2637 domain-containing protein [Nocardia arthritidis]|uniref:DUF2637 domain-containing protein n=1 Tax=Nocardia arthritidis TaxID=228602 RepID=A0A6G9YC15_9NOCA|nr:DUF2637 domain-containing protein [Nocardia arthritidis]QIS10742.1 DUF2637 domain-containing protein [Nocardia arthritidis]